MLDSLFLREIKTEFPQYLLVNISMLDVGYIRIHHKCNQVEDEVGALAKDRECCETKVLETSVVDRLYAAHCVYHFFADLDGWCERFRIPSEDISEID